MLPPPPLLCRRLHRRCPAALPPRCLLPAVMPPPLPPPPLLCCRCHAASVTLPPPLPLSCLSTHNEVNEWAFIKPMTQYNNQQNTMFQYNNQQNTMFQYNNQRNDGLMNGHSLNTMTSYNI
jgi:hypothetical protein